MSVGGSLCQYEDTLTPYLDMTKKIYKGVVAVRKQPESGSMVIESRVYRVKAIDKTYKEDYNPQNFVYVVINPSIRIAHVISNKWQKFW